MKTDTELNRHKDALQLSLIASELLSEIKSGNTKTIRDKLSQILGNAGSIAGIASVPVVAGLIEKIAVIF